MTNEQEKQYIKNIFSKTYHLIDKYSYKDLSDAEWDALIQEAGALEKEFRAFEGNLPRLGKDMIMDLMCYIEKRRK